MFNLENSIRKWLKQFSKHQAFDEGTVREMELHLRDHIDDLVAQGHNEEKAFLLAVREFGEIPGMAAEELSNSIPANRFHYVGMYKNYLRVALRSLTKQPFFTFLNTFGLAVGMAGGLLIALFIYDELSFDRMFSDVNRIYRINIDNRTNGEFSQYAAAPGPIGAVIMEDCPQVESLARFREVGKVLIRKPEESLNVKDARVVAADTAFFSMFNVKLLKGSRKTALRDPNLIVLTESVAKTHFGDQEAYGKSLLLDNDRLFVVSGIIKDFPKNSFLRDHHLFVSLTSYDDAETIAWNTWYFPTFVKLKPGVQVEDFQAFLDTVKDRYLIPWAMTFVPGLTVESAKAAEKENGDFMKFNTTALADIHLYSPDREGEFSANSSIENLYTMIVIGAVLLCLALVNFMNLSTAYSLRRAKEVGIRKTLGSKRSGLIRQFLTESTVITGLSLVFALVIAALVIPFFNMLSGKELYIPFANPYFWVILLASGIALGLLAGAYPAFFMSKFVPAKVLKASHGQVGGSGMRNVLVIFQFGVSVFLIFCTIVVYEQVSFIRNKELGFQKDQVLVIDDVRAAGTQREALKESVRQVSAVADVSLSSYLPTPSERGSVTYFLEGAVDGETFRSESALIIEQWDVDYDYLSTLGLELVAGRGFDKKFGSDSSALLINETTAAMLGVSPAAAIGMRMTTDFHRPDKENMIYMTVIGVVRNFHFETLRNGIDGLTMQLGGNPDKLIVKLNTDELQRTISDIEVLWSSIVPGQPFNYFFLDQSYDDTYRAELRLGSIFITFTMLSIFIACLGLFGLATFNAERRTKEIGIKKVLGASVNQITLQLSLDFLKLVAWSIIIALPLSWYVATRWLEDFSYKMEISWWIFGVAGAIAILISLVTVSYQSIKAALVNPVKSLRSE